MQKVRWGLVSTARINLKVIPAILQSKRGELVAVASRSKIKAEAYARQYKIPHAFGSYQAMFESGEVDAVYISLPNHLHAEWSMRAMEAGLHVLCEKPFATTLQDMDEAIAVKEQTGMALAEAFMYRHHPQTHIVREFIRSGDLGDISLMRGTFNFHLSKEDDTRLVPEWGGGCLWDVGVYPLSYAQFLMGEAPQKVIASQVLGESGIDMHFNAQMWYSGGRTAQISSSFALPFLTYVEVLGTQGRLYIDHPFTAINEGKVVFYPEKGRARRLKVPKMYLYLGEIEDMQAAILDGAPNLVTLEETRSHIKTTLALLKSAERGRVVGL